MVLRRLTGRAGLLIVIGVLVQVASGDTEGEAALVDHILSKQRDQVSSIASLEYNSTVVGSDQSVIQQQFIYDRGMYRCALSAGDPKTPFQKEIAYDGKLYQELDPLDSRLQVTRNRAQMPYLAMECMTFSNIYAIPPVAGHDISIDTLKKKDIWENLAKSVKAKGYSIVQGHKSMVLEWIYPTPEGPVLYQVAFAEELGWQPVQIEAREAGGENRLASRIVLRPARVLDSAGQEVYFPASITLRTFHKSGKQRDETQVDADVTSIRMNYPVKREVFTIPRTQARMYVDSDLAATTEVPPDSLDGIEAFSSANPMDSTVPALSEHAVSRPSNNDAGKSSQHRGSSAQPDTNGPSIDWATAKLIAVLAVLVFAVAVIGGHLISRRHRLGGKSTIDKK